MSVALGLALLGLATATIDVSDGLLGDLGHILKQSGASAIVETDVAIKLVAIKAYWICENGIFSLKSGQINGSAGRWPAVFNVAEYQRRQFKLVSSRWPTPASPSI